jgi:hypothetical protein
MNKLADITLAFLSTAATESYSRMWQRIKGKRKRKPILVPNSVQCQEDEDERRRGQL